MSEEKKTFEIKAVYEDDLEGVMKDLDMWEDYQNGKLKCICGNTITDDNLTAFKKIKGKVYALCSIICT